MEIETNPYQVIRPKYKFIPVESDDEIQVFDRLRTFYPIFVAQSFLTQPKKILKKVEQFIDKYSELPEKFKSHLCEPITDELEDDEFIVTLEDLAARIHADTPVITFEKTQQLLELIILLFDIDPIDKDLEAVRKDAATLLIQINPQIKHAHQQVQQKKIQFQKNIKKLESQRKKIKKVDELVLEQFEEEYQEYKERGYSGIMQISITDILQKFAWTFPIHPLDAEELNTHAISLHLYALILIPLIAQFYLYASLISETDITVELTFDTVYEPFIPIAAKQIALEALRLAGKASQIKSVDSEIDIPFRKGAPSLMIYSQACFEENGLTLDSLETSALTALIESPLEHIDQNILDLFIKHPICFDEIQRTVPYSKFNDTARILSRQIAKSTDEEQIESTIKQIMLRQIIAYQAFNQEIRTKTNQLVELQKQVQHQKKKEQELEQKEQALLQKQKELDDAAHQLESTVERLTEQLQQKNRQIQELSKKDRHNEVKQIKTEELEQQIEQLTKVNQELLSQINSPVIIHEDQSYEQKEQALSQFDLVFIGGHQSWIADMKQCLPNAHFIQAEDYGRSLKQIERCDYLIINTATLNHSIFQKAMTVFERNKNGKRIYLNSQGSNIIRSIEMIYEQL